MDWKKSAREYFAFTRKERTGILVIIALLFFILIVPHFRHSQHLQTAKIDSSIVDALNKNRQDNWNNKQSYNPHRSTDNPTTDNNNIRPQLFYFDPNTISYDEWRRLGVYERTIHTIQNFLSKGGHFKKAEDLKKVYGLRENDYNRLKPYVRIENVLKPMETDQSGLIKYKERAPVSVSIDINSADTSAFISLPGIGSKLASRIVSFRDKLGGFYSIGQIGETFGLQDSVFQKIKQYLRLEKTDVRKININTAGADELKTHPYIRYVLANAIVSYRNEHGPYTKMEDLKKIMAVTEDIYNKITPYLILQ